jgi:hypothetical protein
VELRGHASHAGEGPVAVAVAVLAIVLYHPASPPPAHTVARYARQQVLERWHDVREWRAVQTIVGAESAWNPCRRYPSVTDCRYTGGNSCGVPQATPCPRSWRGRLASTWRAQVRWLVAYLARRYHSPARALQHRQRFGWY